MTLAGLAATVALIAACAHLDDAAFDTLACTAFVAGLAVAVARLMLTVKLVRGARATLATFDWFDTGSLVLAAASVWWIITGPGVPGFRHDWYYSSVASEFARLMFAPLSTWDSAGLGAAQPQAGVYPAYFAMGIVSLVAGPHVAISAFVFAVLAWASLAARRAIAELTGAGALTSWLSGAFYAFGPVALNRLVAGHLMHLYFAAALASGVLIICRRLDEARRRRRYYYDAMFVIAIAPCGHLPNTLLLALAPSVILLLVERRFVLAFGLSAATMLLQLPTLTAILASPGDIYSLKRAVLSWEVAQSADPSHLLHLGGYLAKYSDDCSNVFEKAACALIVACLPLAAAFANRRAASVIAVALLAGLVTMGLLGPLAGVVAWAFDRFSVASLFRELYDIVPLFAFGSALALAIVLERLPKAGRASGVTAAAMLVALAIAPTVLQHEHSYVPIVDDAAQAERIAALPGDARVLWLPGIYPMKTAAGTGDGYDPLTLGHGAHEGVFAQQPPGAIARAYWLLASDPSRAALWLSELGVGWIAIDERARPAGPFSEPSLTKLEAGARAIGTLYRSASDPSLTVLKLSRPQAHLARESVIPQQGRVTESPAGTVHLLVDDPVNAPVLAATSGTSLSWLLFHPSTQTADPQKAFVSARNQWQATEGAADLPGGDAVVANGTTFRAASGVLVAIGRLSRPASVPRNGIGYTTFPHEETAQADGWITALGSRAEIDTATLRRLENGISTKRAIVLRETFDPAWTIAISRSIHFRADGWANGWLVERDAQMPGNVPRYTADAAFAPVVAVVACAWLMLAAAAVYFAFGEKRVN